MLYRPYGKTAVAGDDTFRSKFNTHESDRTALMYFNARYYDAEIGRFVSADTQIPDPRQSQSFNRYMFVCGNPISYIDTDGHKINLGGLYDKVISVTENCWNSNSRKFKDCYYDAKMMQRKWERKSVLYEWVSDYVRDYTGITAYEEGGLKGYLTFLGEKGANALLDLISKPFPFCEPINLKLSYTDEAGWSYGFGYGIKNTPFEIYITKQERGNSRGVTIGCNINFNHKLNNSYAAKFKIGGNITVNEKGLANTDFSTGASLYLSSRYEVAQKYSFLGYGVSVNYSPYSQMN